MVNTDTVFGSKFSDINTCRYCQRKKFTNSPTKLKQCFCQNTSNSDKEFQTNHSTINSERYNIDIINSHYAISQLKIKEAENWTQMATDYITSKNYNKAKYCLSQAKTTSSNLSIQILVKHLEKMVDQLASPKQTYERNEAKIKLPKEANREEAEKCVLMAQSYIIANDFKRAEKMLQKAKKMSADINNDSLLNEINGLLNRPKEQYFAPSDINKGEAERCLELARKSILVKDYEKAQRLLRKGKKMFSLDAIDEELQKLEVILLEEKKRQEVKEKRPEEEKENNGLKKEQQKMVDQILKCKAHQYHKILQVPLNASEKDIKKAYKLLALKVHPDKNSAPGAEDAFKRIVKACRVLIHRQKVERKSQNYSFKHTKSKSEDKTESTSKNIIDYVILTTLSIICILALYCFFEIAKHNTVVVIHNTYRLLPSIRKQLGSTFVTVAKLISSLTAHFDYVSWIFVYFVKLWYNVILLICASAKLFLRCIYMIDWKSNYDYISLQLFTAGNVIYNYFYEFEWIAYFNMLSTAISTLKQNLLDKIEWSGFVKYLFKFTSTIVELSRKIVQEIYDEYLRLYDSNLFQFNNLL